MWLSRTLSYRRTGHESRQAELTHIIVNALGWSASRGNHMIVVPVVDQQHASGTQTLLKVADGSLLFALVSKAVVHVRKGVAQANDGIESLSDHGLDVVVKGQPVGLLNN